ncbi:acyl-CoA-binding domain-containing protein 6 [Elaeis guineensis]|uniref:Acyl-CoA-binding domain-containing protein 6 n=1 Tax=Elaeis guineensis var. tenera TaxID=51953 RepID=A0A6J0PNL0_ELAGV|nr:acyl-CoA-binding domain-containing protein 6 [Elaeis guineensis]XP_019708934.1 acyl-CoA-binding domain-containing protein 6 [Elaeis guineensis]
MAIARASSGPAYPERFYAAAAYAGFGGSSNSSSTGAISKFQNDVALLLYGLYQQATVGPCNIPKPRAWNPVENSKWTSWHGLGNIPSTEAMRLFVKILEEEDPAWYSSVTVEPTVDVEMHKSKVEPATQSATPNGNSLPETKTISAENGSVLEAQDKDVVMEGLSSVGIYDQWVAPSISGQRPKPRYAHGAAIVHDKMYVFGGNHNGRYLNDLQVLDLKSLTWSKIDAKVQTGSPESPTIVPVAPCAGHSLITWGNKILSVAGHTKDPSETITVKEFDPQICIWLDLKTYGKPPISRGGQSVTLVGNTLVMFGGEDAKRSLLNDLHILDLETMTWDEIDAIGTPPSPRSDHSAACHAERYLLIFGGGSHATCFNDLHVLDLQTMEWSTAKQQGVTPGPRAGHASVTVGENWFIVGGGNNINGVSETLVLSMSTLVWSVVTTVQGRMPLASEGLSLVPSTYNGEDFLVSFGGYNGRYSNEVYVLKPSHKADLQSKIIEGPVSDSIAALLPTTNASRDMEPEIEAAQDGKIREIIMDNGDPELVNIRSEETGEQLVATLKAEKEELEATLSKEQLQSLQFKQELAEAETRNAELTKELQSVRGQLAAEQSRCFKLEVDVAELRQKLQTMETLQKEVELLQRQKAASEQAVLSAKQRQSSGGVWGWFAGSPPEKSDS